MKKEKIIKRSLPLSVIITIITPICYLLDIRLDKEEIHQVAIVISVAITIFLAVLNYNKIRINDRDQRRILLENIQEEMIFMKVSIIKMEKTNKYTDFAVKLGLAMKTKVKRLTNKMNSELKKNLRLANKLAISIIKDMLRVDFAEITQNEIINDLIDAEDSVGNSINYKLLNISDIQAYKYKLKNKQERIFNSFAVEIIEIIETQKNGDREPPLRTACLNFAENIVNNALSVHAEFTIKK